MFTPSKAKTQKMFSVVTCTAAIGNDKARVKPNTARKLERIKRKWYIVNKKNKQNHYSQNEKCFKAMHKSADRKEGLLNA